jgi:hypothetical protein
MDQNEVLQMLIEDAVKRVTAPLEAEVKALRAELELLKGGSSANGVVTSPPSASEPSMPTVSSQVDPEPSSDESATSNLGVNPEVPAERTDFMRFLQRGLEQEEKEYAEREDTKPEKKRGWNPFKR